MKLKDYRERRMQDPEMQAAYQKLRPKLEVARQILHARLERGWTQRDLAEKAETKQANISRLENALLNPTIEMLQKLANALGTRLVIDVVPEQEAPQVEPSSAKLDASDKIFVATVREPAPQGPMPTVAIWEHPSAVGVRFVFEGATDESAGPSGDEAIPAEIWFSKGEGAWADCTSVRYEPKGMYQ